MYEQDEKAPAQNSARLGAVQGADTVADPPSFSLHCETINGCNEGLANVNDRLERILDRTRGNTPKDDAEVVRGISSAGYDDTLGQLGSVYDNQLKRYFCLIDELERFL